MSHEKSISIMRDMADKGELDGTVVRDLEVAMGSRDTNGLKQNQEKK